MKCRRNAGLGLAALVLALAGLLCLFPLRAAQAATVVNASVDIPFDVFVPCANGGSGEVVAGTLTLHELITETISNSGNVELKTHFQPQGSDLVGTVTGDAYQATGVTQETDTFKTTLGSEFTFVNNFRIIGQGPGNNYLVHETFHATVNANGVLTVVHDNFSVDCK